jgi:hypothetical protein
MPEVTVRYNPQKISESRLAELLSTQLCRAVATYLRCDDPGGDLDSQDVEVYYQPFGKNDKTNDMDIAVGINANFYPRRAEDLKDRNIKILGEVEKAISLGMPGDTKGYVWIHLSPSAFKEISIG